MPKKSKRKPIPGVFILLLATIPELCHGYDITTIYEFGCTWLGGGASGTLTCSCSEGAKEMYLQKGSIPSFDTTSVLIANCDSVRFGSESISTSRNLRNIELKNIMNLYFEDSSLVWDGYTQNINPHSYVQNIDFSDRTIPGLRVTIENSRIREISSYAFKGRINEITFKDNTVDKILPFAFTSLVQTIHIDFSNTIFRDIQQQAFKKFSTNDLILKSNSFNNIPSRAFSEVTVLERFLIKNCSFARINPSGFIVNSPRHFDIINSKFDLLDGEAFKVLTRGDVTVKDNYFNITNGGAFLGIQLNREQINVEQKFSFDSNTFNALHGDTLATDSKSFQTSYNDILLNQTCDCWYIDRFLEDNRFYEEINCLLEDGEQITMKEFKHYNCSIISSFSTIIIIVCVVLILLVIILTILIVYLKRVFWGTKQKEYITDKNGKPLGLIVPDGRTYRETELHVIVERTDLLTTDL